ncbi:hypothetical protein ASPWEDRAFT_42920 [Aspergillus wentii DTO 134E9]|uniref:DNA (cytosine-5-)-methyltransferase n=1 Tax=Aspergillus wentii DTO 134E9 TaxID=1073089 RepID=A0A1L9RD86_ASPWE|nr:uncharacterized protein ASPWEDRAFT_42920 [Aspergillus wentii DTO 134E9]OJJ32881.1 hypothetical protein ASPWEDRAFT_42920 [Aspergillus wentii DTO 134E9]
MNIWKSDVKDWGSKDAFHEFYQNWKQAIIDTFDLKERFKATYEEDKTAIKIIVAAPDNTPRKPSYLGFIRFMKITGEVALVSASATLELNCFQLGTTPRNTGKNLAGSHGEGIELATMAMTGFGYEVRIQASNCDWCFASFESQLHCIINPSEAEDRPPARPRRTLAGFGNRIVSDVAITIGGGLRKVERFEFLRWLGVSLDIVGFGQPLSLVETPNGDLILDHNFANKVYMNGTLLPVFGEKTGPFDYGYNITRGTWSTDRGQFENDKEAARSLCSVWEAAIEQNQEALLPKYVGLLRNRPEAPDIRCADRLLELVTAKKIWEHLLSEAGGREFYYLDKPNKVTSKDIKIIHDSLKKKPVRIADILWNLLRRWSLIRTPEEECIQQFRNSPEWLHPGLEFSDTIQQALKASLAMHKATEGIEVMFVDCRHRNIDTYFEPMSKLLKVNKRWLEFDAIHQKHPCRISKMDAEETKDNSFFCDHIVECLYEVAMRQILRRLPDTVINAEDFNNNYNELREKIRQMPRQIAIVHCLRSGQTKVCWEDRETDTFSQYYGDKTQYHVVLHDEACWESVKNKTLHEYSDPMMGDNTPCGCKQKFVPQRKKVAIFDGLYPAQRYVPMVAYNEKGTFYGFPLKLVRPVRAPSLIPERSVSPFSGESEGTMDVKSEQVESTPEEEKHWEFWHKEEFPRIFSLCTPRGEHGTTYTRPLAAFASQRLNWMFKGGQYVSVTMKSQFVPVDSCRHILRIHGIYSANKSGSQEGKILATQYSFLRRSPIFMLENALKGHPEIDEKELLLHFNDVDFMGQKNDASLIPIENITDVDFVRMDLLGPAEAVQYTVDVTEGLLNSGLFCRFAIKCGGSPDSACLMPVTHDLLPFSKHWDTPEYSSSSRLEVFDFSPGVLGLAEGFRQSGCAVRAGFGFDPVSDLTWKVRYPATVVYDGPLDSILSDFNSLRLNAPLSGAQGVPKIAILSIPDKGIEARSKQIREDIKILENINSILGLYPEKMSALVFTFPDWIFHEDAFFQFLKGMYDLLQGRYSIHLKKVSLSQYGLPQDRTVIVFVATSFCSPIQWEDVFDKNVPTDLKLPRECIGSLRFQNARGVEDSGKKSFICKYPDAEVNIYNHQTGRQATDSQILDMDSVIDMRNGPCLIQHSDGGGLLTVRELARIQGFDDDFVFYGTIERQYEEVMQAFPPTIAKRLADTILDSIKEFGSLGEADESHRAQKRRRGE